VESKIKTGSKGKSKATKEESGESSGEDSAAEKKKVKAGAKRKRETDGEESEELLDDTPKKKPPQKKASGADSEAFKLFAKAHEKDVKGLKKKEGDAKLSALWMAASKSEIDVSARGLSR
jgi:hypothetical protein